MADNPNKGVQGLDCNRTDCQEPPADYYNHSTRKWYCADCAAKINRMNPESYQMFGHELCTHKDSDETIKALSNDN